MKKQFKWFVYPLLSVMFLVGATMSRPEPAAASTTVLLSSLQAGDTVNFAGYPWIVLDPASCALLMQNAYGSNRPFDTDGNNVFSPNDESNIGWYLNNANAPGGFYSHVLNADPVDATMIPTVTWAVGNETSEADNIIGCKVALLDYDSFQADYDVIDQDVNRTATWWMMTPVPNSTSEVWGLYRDPTFGEDFSAQAITNNLAVYPVVNICPKLSVSGGAGGTVIPFNAGSSSVTASPSSVTADGATSATIKVELKNFCNFSNWDLSGVSGVTVSLSQGNGHSVITPVDNGVTDSNGVATFTVTDATPEAVTYTATATTDSDVAVGTAQVQFTRSPQITSASSTAFTTGSSRSFTVTTTGNPAPSLTELGILPSGVTFTDNGNGTATLAGVPGSGTGGVYPLIISARNSFGLITQQFILTATAVQTQTPTPIITTPIVAGATSVSGMSVADAKIALVINGGTGQTTTASAGGNWNVSGLTLTVGDIIAATAQAPGETVSQPATATVAQTPTPTIFTPIAAGASPVGGLSVMGATISLTVNGGAAHTVKVDDDGIWSVTGLSKAVGDIISVTAQASGEAVSKPATAIVAQTPTPTITTPIAAGATSVSGLSVAGAAISLTVNGGTAYPATVGTDGRWRVSGLTLAAGDIISVTAQASGEVVSQPVAAIIAQTPTPTITTPIAAGATSVSGTSVANAVISLAVNGGTVHPVTADPSEHWTVSGLTLAVGDVISVTAQVPGEAASQPAAAIIAQTPTPAITTPIAAGATSVSGASVAGAKVSLAVNGGTVPTVMADPFGRWTVSDLSVETVNQDGHLRTPNLILAVGDIISVTAQAPGEAVSQPATAIVAQTPTPTITTPIAAGATTVSGTSVPEASISLTVNGGKPLEIKADQFGNWTITDLTAQSLNGLTVGLDTPSLAVGDIISVTAQALGEAISQPATATVAQTPTPTITTPIAAGATSVNGTSVVNATISLNVNGGMALATKGDAKGYWTISGLTLRVGDIISVTAWTLEDEISQPATATVVAATTQLTGVAITGTPQVGDVLTANVLPTNAVANYQWQECIAENGAYTAISGAIAGSYTLVSADVGKYIEVVATGNYGGEVTSAAIGPVVAAVPVVTTGGGGGHGGGGPVTTQLTGIGDITGTPQVGTKLTAGAVTPSNATVDYQWQECATEYGTYSAISGATSITYTLVTAYQGDYIKVEATGTGNYRGTVASAPVGQVIAATTPLTGVAIAGTPQVGGTLTAGLTPSDATASYKWQECATQSGTYTAISGATSSTYAPVTTDVGKYIEVVATGSSGYSGSATSLPTGVVRAAAPVPAALSTPAISGAAQVGVELMASVKPSDAAVTYQWAYSTTGVAGSYSDITGATGSSNTIDAAYLGDYIEVVATLATTDATYTAGSATSAAAGPVTIPLTAIGETGLQVNGDGTVTLTVGSLTPSGATASYQWLESTDGGASYTPNGVTSSTYATGLNINDFGTTYNFKVVATGMGNYSGTVTSGPLSF